jgi:hypothetical protein
MVCIAGGLLIAGRASLVRLGEPILIEFTAAMAVKRAQQASWLGSSHPTAPEGQLLDVVPQTERPPLHVDLVLAAHRMKKGASINGKH